MILHPSSLEKLRAEVLAGPVDTAWTYARLQNLKYRKFIISTYVCDRRLC